MNEVRFEILKHIGVISKGKWKNAELNIVSWNGAEPKYDIRSWNEDHTSCSKGIALTRAEFEALVMLGHEHLRG